jgi:hypothetical protein
MPSLSEIRTFSRKTPLLCLGRSPERGDSKRKTEKITFPISVYSGLNHGSGLSVVNTLKSSYWYWRREGNPAKEEKKEWKS